MAAADENAERERRRAADAVLAMDQHPLAAIEMAVGEGDAFAKHCGRDGAVVLGRQMQEREPVALEHDGVVAGLDPQVDDGPDPQLARQNLRVGGPEAAADREVVGDPAQVQRRRHHGMRPTDPAGRGANRSGCCRRHRSRRFAPTVRPRRHLRAVAGKPADRRLEAFLERHLGRPAEKLLRQADVGTPPARIVDRQRPPDDPRPRSGHRDDARDELVDGQLDRVAEIDRARQRALVAPSGASARRRDRARSRRSASASRRRRP